MSVGIDLVLDGSRMQAAVREAGAAPQQARLAALRAFRRLRTHINSVTRKQAAATLGVPGRALKRRWRSDPPDEMGMRIWVGTWMLAPELMATPRQTPGGVRVGRWFFPGAFYGRVWAHAGPGIYIRKSSRHYDPALYPALRPGTAPAGLDYWRFPVIRVRVPIEQAVVGSFAGHETAFGEFFFRRFEHELRRVTTGAQ